MKKCNELLEEFGVDYLEKQKIPKEVEQHFKNCNICLNELKKQEAILNLFNKVKIKKEIPEFDPPPVLRKKDKFPFLILSIFFLFFFIFFHSLLNIEYLKTYILIFSNINLLSPIKLNLTAFFLILLIASITISIFYKVKKYLKNL